MHRHPQAHAAPTPVCSANPNNFPELAVHAVFQRQPLPKSKPELCNAANANPAEPRRLQTLISVPLNKKYESIDFWIQEYVYEEGFTLCGSIEFRTQALRTELRQMATKVRMTM